MLANLTRSVSLLLSSGSTLISFALSLFSKLPSMPPRRRPKVSLSRPVFERGFATHTHQDWKLQDIPDLVDPDPLRYAIVAPIVDDLHEAGNWRLSLGLRRNREHMYCEKDGGPWPPFTLEELPGWTKKVAPVDKDRLRLSVPLKSLDV